MGDVFFVLKSLGITVAVVLLMQIKVGPATIEQHSIAWMHESTVVDELRFVSEGAVKAIQQGTRYVSSFFETNTSKIFGASHGPGTRLDSLRFKRSESVEREQERKRIEREARESEANDDASETSPVTGADQS